MDLKNVRIDWGPILEGQIKHLESMYPDIPVRKSYSAVIEALNQNKLKSRVILSGITVSAYAFITPSKDLTDRIYGSMGFTDPAFASEERVTNLLSWLEDSAKARGKHLMLNEVYNAEEVSEKVMLSRGLKKFVRNRLYLDLTKAGIAQPNPVVEYQEIPLRKLKIENYADSEFEAFSGTPDEILFNSANRKERVEFVRSLFNGKYGKVIEPASKILTENNKVIAGTLCTQYRSTDGTRTALLVDIFVVGSHQRKGIARSLLLFSLNALKKLGYEECDLWVSEDNPAKILYQNVGFLKSKTEEIFYYKTIEKL